MNFVKKSVLTAVFTSLVFTFACGNNTPSPASTTTDPATAVSAVVEGLQFTGKADVAEVSILIADNYLSKVVTGNPYPAQPACAPSLTNFVTISKAEIKITNFTYYGKGVDVTCKKDVPNGNSLPLVSFGSDTAGNYGHFILCPNGTYSFVDSSNQSTSQGSDDEITQIIIAVDSPFLCEGSDGNEYEATMYSIYNGDYNLNIASLFETKTKVFTGVISVKLKDSQDVARDIFFE